MVAIYKIFIIHSLHATLLLFLQKIEVLEKLDHIHSKLLYRIEEFEKRLDHLSKESEHQGKRLRRHSEELECLNKKVRTEDEEKETYSEFSDKKGINLCRLKHEIFMQIFVRCLVCKQYKKVTAFTFVDTHRRTGAKRLERLSFLARKLLRKMFSSPPPPPPPPPQTMNVFVSRSRKIFETPCSSQF